MKIAVKKNAVLILCRDRVHTSPANVYDLMQPRHKHCSIHPYLDSDRNVKDVMREYSQDVEEKLSKEKDCILEAYLLKKCYIEVGSILNGQRSTKHEIPFAEQQ